MKRPGAAAALYARLSREDALQEQSGSIDNQLRQLRSFAQGEGYAPLLEFVDDGYSGTSFERPGLQALLEAVEAGLVCCVVVKDLSRFGRDHLETGYYLERYFPLRGIRFVALNDGIDSANSTLGGNSALLVAVKNLLNEEYARDISRKVKSALRAKKQSGYFACPFAPYGYDKTGEGGLSICEEEAQVVRLIYSWRGRGTAILDIAKRLNDLLIPSPATAKADKTRYINKNAPQEWGYQAVYRVLSNKIYAGILVMGKTERISHKLKKRNPISLNNQIVLQKSHLNLWSEKTRVLQEE